MILLFLIFLIQTASTLKSELEYCILSYSAQNFIVVGIELVQQRLLSGNFRVFVFEIFCCI